MNNSPDVPTPRPRIFVSCVTSEFHSARDRVANVLRYLGYEPETEEIFGTASGDLRQLLRGKIDDCDGFIQIVGWAYGAEPPCVDPEVGRVSYTQFEYAHARKAGKKTWLILAGDGCSRDKRPEMLDLPPESDSAAPETWQAERRALQEHYRATILSETRVYYEVADDVAMENAVLKIRNDSKELQEQFRLWQRDLKTEGRRMSWKLNLISLALGLGITGGALAFRHFDSRMDEPRHVNAPAIRGKLADASSRIFDQEKSKAENESDPQRKKELLNAAEVARRSRDSSIDDLVRQFSDLEANKLASDDFNELRRILEIEDGGVEKALSFLERRRGDILRSVKSDDQKRRRLLQPLLEGAKIAVTNGRNEQARSLFLSVVEADPAWSEARVAYWEFLSEILGPDREVHDTRYAVMENYREAERQAHRLAANAERSADPGAWRTAQDRWRRSLLKLGDLARSGKTPSDLETANDYYHESRKILESIAKSDPESIHWQNDLGVVFRCIGDVAREQRRWDEATGFYRTSREFHERPRASIDDERMRQHDLALTYQCLGDVAHGRFTAGSIEEALEAYDKARHLRESLLEEKPGDPMLKHELAAVLQKLGELHMNLGDLEKADGFFRLALGLRKEFIQSAEREPYWNNDLAISLTCLGDVARKRAERMKSEDSPDLKEASAQLSEARTRYGEALAIRNELKQLAKGDRKWDMELSTNELNLGDVCMARLEWNEAGAHYMQALELRTTLSILNPGEPRTRHSLAWACRLAGDLEAAKHGSKDDFPTTADGYYTRYVVTSKELAEQFPDDLQWAQHHALAVLKYGEFMLACNSIEMAAARFRESIELMNRIPPKDALNLNWQIDLATARCKLACLEGKPGIPPGSTQFQEARNCLRVVEEVVKNRYPHLSNRCEHLDKEITRIIPRDSRASPRRP